MEVEVKLRLADDEAHALVATLLSDGHAATHNQENFFFDGKDKELSSKRAILRVRFFNVDDKAVLTLKGQQVVQDGIGRAAESEEEVDVQMAREFLKQPDELLKLNSKLVEGMKSQYGVKGLECLGGFRNTRQVYEWNGFTLELDETHYDFGTLYELECETDDPEGLRDKLEKLFVEKGIAYSYSKRGKFAHFLNKNLGN